MRGVGEMRMTMFLDTQKLIWKRTRKLRLTQQAFISVIN